MMTGYGLLDLIIKTLTTGKPKPNNNEEYGRM